jgi:hypothetical protein
METTGIFVAFIGAAAVFFADWQNLSTEWVAGLLLGTAAVYGFCVNRWRVRLSLFLTATLIAAEWASEHMQVYATHVHNSFPNMFILAGLSFIFAFTVTLIGAGFRSFFDAGRK